MPCIGIKANGAPCQYDARIGFQTCGHHRRQEPAAVVPEVVVVQPVVQPVVRPRRRRLPVVRFVPMNQLPPMNPPVHVHDPVGGIDLAAFANDKQSVHRGSVQKETENNIKRILEVPLLPSHLPLKGSCYFEFIYALGDIPEKHKDIPTVHQVLWIECGANITAFGTDHRTVFKHVWSYIQTHEHRRELMCRLCEEVMESAGMCSNGKICRLVNALQGFMDGLEAPVSKMEVFQNKIAKLMDIPVTERTAKAMKLFEKYKIPEDQREIWLAPLIE